MTDDGGQMARFPSSVVRPPSSESEAFMMLLIRAGRDPGLARAIRLGDAAVLIDMGLGPGPARIVATRNQRALQAWLVRDAMAPSSPTGASA
jgi:hypothetical protein